jgi:fatty-acid peroxygenase
MIPSDPSFDSSLAFLREGYMFVSNRCHRFRSDLFAARINLEKTVCVLGEEAAITLLQDLGSVATLDGDAHRHRKAMFMSFMGRQELDRFTELATQEWQSAIERWQRKGKVVLLDEVHELLCRAVFKWVGLPLSEPEVEPRTTELAAMIDGAGSVGLRNVRGHLLRQRSERWLRERIVTIRRGRLEVSDTSPVAIIAGHRDSTGGLLPTEIATVELLNLVRPTVATARYVVFAALALYRDTRARDMLAAGGREYAHWFVQEVRRYYPFFPLIAGRVQEEFEWRDYRFTRGLRVMLDLFGTNHDPRLWETPAEFKPERFGEWQGGAFDLIPQGGGDHYQGHRCAGEWLTIEQSPQSTS